MPTQLQLRRGTTSQNNSFTGAAGELSIDTDLDQIRIHDGSAAGGVKVPATGLAFGAAGNTNPATNTVSLGTPANVVIRSNSGVTGNVIVGDATATTSHSLDVRGTANVGALAATSVVPQASDGGALGSASLEWADLFLADGAVVSFGDDQEITLTHVADSGLNLKHAASADDKFPTFTFQTGDDDIAVNDKLGVINFQAPDEGAGTDAILVAAGIEAVSEGNFAADNNATKLSFKTAASAAAAETMALSSTGNLTLSGLLTDGDGGSAVPPGAILPYGGATAPTGYALCDDTAKSRTDFAALFAIIGTTYGAGNGTTTFNLPDLRDRIPLGKGTNNSTLGAETTGASASAVVATASGSASLTLATGTFATSAKDSSTSSAVTGVTAGGHTHNLTLPVQVMNYIIKT
jgi:microcystin-dependent protein